MNEKKVSIIICAYNEEKTLENVVRHCHQYNPNSEIIVVNDGSDDHTHEIMKKLENELVLKYIHLPENKGKSYAMVTGVEQASNSIILFFDADITGIKAHHFDQLLDPVLQEQPEADMVLGTPSNTFIDYRINPFKSLTGERAMFKKDLLPILEDIRNIRFGVETYINLYFQAKGKKIKYLLLEGLTNPVKHNKMEAGKATTELFKESKEVAITLLKNYNLLIKSIGNSFDEQSEKIKESFLTIYNDINKSLNDLLNNKGHNEK